MPSAPLIDFDSIDLSRVVVTREAVREFCKQREHFEMLDGLLHFDLEGKRAVGFKDLTPHDWWAAGHIPGRPIFPGALQCEGAAQLCTYDFMHRRTDLAGAFVGFAGMNGTRFRGIVEPPCRMLFVGEVQSIRKTMFTYYAQGFVDRRLVFETEIMGVVV
jgi:3-hydroxymyristoyl/3-hydroxydecanoyl-(acyl carrier protein) dehydratase